MGKTAIFSRMCGAQKAVLSSLLGVAVCLLSAICVQADPVRLKWVEAGAAGRMPPGNPQRIELNDQRPPDIQRLPAGVANPLYGVISLGPADSLTRVSVLLDAPPGRAPRLFVDTNGNGDLADDPRPEWKPIPYADSQGKQFTRWTGGVTVRVSYGSTQLPIHLILQRYDPTDPVRVGFKGAILYSPDYAREGELKLGAKSYHVMLQDALTGGDFRGVTGGSIRGIFLLIDVNGNGRFDARGEIFDLGRPFNIGGFTYAFQGLTASGETLNLVRSAVKVAEVPPPPDLRIGKIVPAFEKRALGGAPIRFPAGYRGKLVLLYFWASDCGVCAVEMPEVVRSYTMFHPQGLEILGVSLDHENAGPQITAFTKRQGMLWPEIYDGKWLQADIAQLYFVQRTPTAILVDGKTGKVLAAGDDLRGGNLQKALAVALTSHKK